ncbi:MAG: single-stranded DNA-binding protein [Rikenellaceae bacterium]|nr:single-stranded DNA-binding protein [Rikenellaceae bacterium]
MVNKAILIGNVGADPEVRSLESGVKVCRIRLATTERVRKDDGWGDHTEWHTVVLWRGLADVADKYVRKGSRIYVEGPLRSNEWTDKDGNRRVTIEIIASEMKLLDRRADGDAAPRTAAPVTTPAAAPKPVVPPTVADDDDLPF